ncbi:6-phospho-beta-glucosidase [Virgibacillus halodenitrificans]|uniref:6-phospho-beta-glucosidase n=1 Tax=Virgibacillus halodenitrificans TaxID=1482 RepID=A0AAC9NMX7_VIRHA|nr:6-phospho-beta-glucosidase [Virgibacillus halodenitrificans]APC50079.1 6-phospho-beta-glucosidase [Virgibacillus halodenitrificans]MYL56725.1 6-phospho-beta-glucosidase [Virgibacillus halodenitrificans]
MSVIKLTVVGGGSSYTPELIEGILKNQDILNVSEIWLVDVKEGEEKLAIIEKLANRMVKESHTSIKIVATLNRREAIKDASYVITQIRVGQLKMRKYDEYISIKHGVIGQETTGAGGFMKALRTIPVILDICKDIEELAPDAWLLNFTNPAGIITEAVLKHSSVKVIGLCNNPINFYKKFADIYHVPIEEVSINFTGINHLIWITGLFINGESKIDDILTGKSQSYEAKNIPDFGWDVDFLQSLGAIPCGYHKYYYQTDKILKEQLEQYRENKTRADQVQEIEKGLFELFKNPDLTQKPKELDQRGGAFYSEAAINLICSLHLNTGNIHTLNVRNNGTIACLPDNVSIEVNCVVEKHQVTPMLVGDVSPQIRGLLQHVKAYEELTIEAAVKGSWNLAFQALAMHPLLPSTDVAKKVLNEMLEVNEHYLPAFH